MGIFGGGWGSLFDSLRFSLTSSCTFFMVSFSNVFNHTCTCLLSLSEWCVFTGVLGTHSWFFPRVLCLYTVSPLYRSPFPGRVLPPGLGASARITAPASAQDPSGQSLVGPHLRKFPRLELLDLRDQVYFGLNTPEVKTWEFYFPCGDFKEISNSFGGTYQLCPFIFLKGMVLFLFVCF